MSTNFTTVQMFRSSDREYHHPLAAAQNRSIMRTFALAQFLALTRTILGRASAFSSLKLATATSTIGNEGIRKGTATTRLDMVKNRGLEIPEEGATPLRK